MAAGRGKTAGYLIVGKANGKDVERLAGTAVLAAARYVEMIRVCGLGTVRVLEWGTGREVHRDVIAGRARREAAGKLVSIKESESPV